MSTMINRSGSSAVIHVTANDCVVIAGNSSVSNIAFGNSSVYETITAAAITQVWWGSASIAGNSYWIVNRGVGNSSVANVSFQTGNTVLVLPDSGYMDFAGTGASLIKNATGNCSLGLINSTTGYLMIEFQKTPTIDK
jgi:hypothetical protein